MIRVLLVTETRLIGDTLATVLQDEADMEVIGCVDSMAEALVKAADADVALVSATLPYNGALELIRTLSAEDSPLKVLVLGLVEAKGWILPYIEAGAHGYVLQSDSVEQMLERIRAAVESRAVVSPKVAAALINRVAELAQASATVEPGLDACSELTPREREILSLVAQGMSNQEIANELIIEVGTVKNHVHSILQKLDVSSRRDAVAYLPMLRQAESAGRLSGRPVAALSFTGSARSREWEGATRRSVSIG